MMIIDVTERSLKYRYCAADASTKIRPSLTAIDDRCSRQEGATQEQSMVPLAKRYHDVRFQPCKIVLFEAHYDLGSTHTQINFA
jgi:hypothetical protein